MPPPARQIDSETSHGISPPPQNSSASLLARRLDVRRARRLRRSSTSGSRPRQGRIPQTGRPSTPMSSRADHDRMANAIRALAMDAVEQAKSGHPGLPLRAADIATALFLPLLTFDQAVPDHHDRDR